jgi:hypothetical protein
VKTGRDEASVPVIRSVNGQAHVVNETGRQGERACFGHHTGLCPLALGRISVVLGPPQSQIPPPNNTCQLTLRGSKQNTACARPGLSPRRAPRSSPGSVWARVVPARAPIVFVKAGACLQSGLHMIPATSPSQAYERVQNEKPASLCPLS